MHGFYAVDGPASRRKFVFGTVSLGASRWPPQIVIRYPCSCDGGTLYILCYSALQREAIKGSLLIIGFAAILSVMRSDPFSSSTLITIE